MADKTLADWPLKLFAMMVLIDLVLFMPYMAYNYLKVNSFILIAGLSQVIFQLICFQWGS